MNPDVRHTRAALHEAIPGDKVTAAGKAWQVQHKSRNIGLEAANVSMFNVFGTKRVSPVDEFFPAAKRA